MSIEKIKDMEERIIEAAKVVFVRKGYEATKMGDVAAEVGITRTALHYYFRTKEMLFEAIFGQLMGRLFPNIGSIMAEPTTILEKIPRIIDDYTEFLHTNALFPIFVVSEMNRDPQHLYNTVLKDPQQITPILQMREQIQDEMDHRLLKKRPEIDIVTTLLGLLVFPFLARNPMTDIFLDGNRETFETYIEKRKNLVKDIMKYILTPDK